MNFVHNNELKVNGEGDVMNRPSVPEAAEVLAEMTGGGCVVNEGADSSADAAYRYAPG